MLNQLAGTVSQHLPIMNGSLGVFEIEAFFRGPVNDGRQRNILFVERCN